MAADGAGDGVQPAHGGEAVEVSDEVTQVVEYAAGIDVAKGFGMGWTRGPGARPGRTRQKVWRVNATFTEVTALMDHLVCAGIQRLVLESTSDYWRIWYYLAEAAGLEVWLVNARGVKHLPGRSKSDRLDCVWLCKLNEWGMLRRSFVPPEPVRDLRALTRLRANPTHDRVRHQNRIEEETRSAHDQWRGTPTLSGPSRALAPAGFCLFPACVVAGPGCHRRRCDDDFGARVVGDLRGTADDNAGAFPGPLGGVEGYFLGHPPVLVERRPVNGPVGQVGRRAIGRPGGGAPSCLPLVGLHPDQRVDQVRHIPAPGAVPFDDQQRAAGRDLERSFPAVLVPSRRPVPDRLAVVRGHQDPVNQQAGPAEAGVFPGDVIGVDDSRSGDQLAVTSTSTFARARVLNSQTAGPPSKAKRGKMIRAALRPPHQDRENRGQYRSFVTAIAGLLPL